MAEKKKTQTKAKTKKQAVSKQEPVHKKRSWLIVLLLLLAIGLTITALLSYRDNDQKQCQETATSVRLSENATEQYTVAGELCYKGSLNDKTVQLLVSGHTYDRTYWDFIYEPEKYSYVDAALEAGYATLNIDRPGVGKSDIPSDPTQLTTPSQAYVIHQLVKALRAGEIVDTKVGKVVLVGHSLGTGIALYAAGAYGDVDAVVGTGGLGDTNPEFIPALQANFYPANQDPKFTALDLPDGYITTQPGTRGQSFYNTDYADPMVIENDESTKQPGTPQAIITLPQARTSEIGANLRLPLFFPVGEKDALYCDTNNPDLPCDTADAIVAREKKFFPQACIEAYIQPTAGHDGVLHPNAPEMFDAVNSWITTWVGKTTKQNPQRTC